MYDFSYKNSGKILKGSKESEDFLIFVKRLLPRWANGIPDSECIAIFKVLNSLRKKQKKTTYFIRNRIGSKYSCYVSSLCTFWWNNVLLGY